MYFRRGLNPAIQRQVSVSDTRPDNNDLQGWYNKAKRFYDSDRANAIFEAGNTCRTTPATHARTYFAKPANPPPPSPTTTTRPFPDGRHRPSAPAPTCDLCGNVGHSSKSCYVRHKIRGMLAEDRDDWVTSLLAAADAAEAEARSASIFDESETVAQSEQDLIPLLPLIT